MSHGRHLAVQSVQRFSKAIRSDYSTHHPRNGSVANTVPVDVGGADGRLMLASNTTLTIGTLQVRLRGDSRPWRMTLWRRPSVRGALLTRSATASDRGRSPHIGMRVKRESR